MPGRTPRKTATSERSADSSSSATALRTVTCGELTAANEGQRVVLAGWVAHRRDYGKLLFIDLRDRYGLTQIVIDPERSPEAAEAHRVAVETRLEYVLRVEGVVAKRLPGKENPALVTGEIEVEAQRVEVLNTAKTLPFPISDYVEADEALRLRYRYLDLRRASDAATTSSCATASVKFIRDYPGRARLPRGRDADPGQEHAGGRARLPGAEPRPSRQVLRAAAVAAAVQAVADGRRASTATSRSRAASATRTCAPTASRSSPSSTWRCRLSMKPT